MLALCSSAALLSAGRGVAVWTVMPFAPALGQEVCVWVSPGRLCWDEHATAPDLCHPPWRHLLAGVWQRKSKGQRQTGMRRALLAGISQKLFSMFDVSPPFRAKCQIMHHYFRLIRLLVDKVEAYLPKWKVLRQCKVVLTVQFCLYSTSAAHIIVFNINQSFPGVHLCITQSSPVRDDLTSV